MERQYLPYIDGLRAIAVTLVIFHHLKIFGMAGGFIGVDIFFVISGYLITRNLISDYNNHTLSIYNFYKSRIIRLAPAFFTVITASIALFCFILTPEELIKFYQSIIYSNLFVMNFYLSKELGNYFSINTATMPLMHFWSLAVEEQYYIVWPLILVAILKIKKHALAILIVLFIYFLALSETASVTDKNIAYFLPQYRAFELILGALICFIPPTKHSKLFALLISYTSITSIVLCAIHFNKNTAFPGLHAFIPCISTACIIYFYQKTPTTHLNLLQNKVIAFMGKISYPAYLWHWPLIVYVNIFSIKINWFIATLIIFATLLLSTLTYKFIEPPAKTLKEKSFRQVFKKLFILPTLLIVLICLIGIYLNEFKHTRTLSQKQKTSSLNAIKCIDTGPSVLPFLEECYLGIKKKNEIDFLLIGDSHANAQSPIIDIFAKDLSLKGYEITQSSTVFLPDIDRLTHKGNAEYLLHIDFRQRNDIIKQMIQHNSYKYVIMGGFFPHIEERSFYIKDNRIENSAKIFINGLEEAIQIILRSGATPVIIQDNPLLKNVDVNCAVRPWVTTDSCHFEYSSYIKDTTAWNNHLNNLKRKFPKLIVIDFTPILCDGQYCQSSLEHTPLYRDMQHLSYAGARVIGKHYLLKYGNPLRK